MYAIDVLKGEGNQRRSNSQGFNPVCFLKAVEKCEMEEYPKSTETSVTVKPFSYNRYLACSNLDTQGIELYHSLIEQYCRQRLVVVCSNDPVEYGFCQEVIAITDYKVPQKQPVM